MVVYCVRCVLCGQWPLRREDRSFSGVPPGVCVCLIVCDLGSLVIRRLWTQLFCCVIENKIIYILLSNQTLYYPTNAQYIICRYNQNYKIFKSAPNMFRITEDPSSGSLKITRMILSCPLTWTTSVLWQHILTRCACVWFTVQEGTNYTHAQRVTICCHNTDLVHIKRHDRISLVIFIQARLKAP